MTKEEFIQFYNQHIDKIYRFIFFRVDREETAQDLSSEAFLKLWESIDNSKYKLVENPRALLYQIARNLVTDFYRQKGKFEIAFTSNDPEFLEIPAKDNLLEKISLESDFGQLKKAFKKIQPEQQEAVLLRYVEGIEIGEIAKILNKSEGAVRVLVHRGLTALRKVLEA